MGLFTPVETALGDAVGYVVYESISRVVGVRASTSTQTPVSIKLLHTSVKVTMPQQINVTTDLLDIPRVCPST